MLDYEFQQNSEVRNTKGKFTFNMITSKVSKRNAVLIAGHGGPQGYDSRRSHIV
jgi:hypothetical protein